MLISQGALRALSLHAAGEGQGDGVRRADDGVLAGESPGTELLLVERVVQRGHEVGTKITRNDKVAVGPSGMVASSFASTPVLPQRRTESRERQRPRRRTSLSSRSPLSLSSDGSPCRRLRGVSCGFTMWRALHASGKSFSQSVSVRFGKSRSPPWCSCAALLQCH